VDTLRLPSSLASLVTANVAPVVGVLVLGWSPIAILILYFVDTLLSLGVVMLMVMLHVTGNARGQRFSGFQDWAQGIGALVFLGAIFALPLSLPLWFIGPPNVAAEFERPGSGLFYAILLQVAMSAYSAVRMHRDLEQRHDDDRVLVRRGLYVMARWITLFIAMGTGLVELFGARVGRVRARYGLRRRIRLFRAVSATRGATAARKPCEGHHLPARSRRTARYGHRSRAARRGDATFAAGTRNQGRGQTQAREAPSAGMKR